MSLRIETIAIGDELLTGKISDTNSQFVAEQLFARGASLQRSTVIPDDIPVIRNTLRERASHADFVICFGGLGPTSDDKTAEAAAGLLGSSLETHAPTRAKLEEFCRARQRELTPQMLKQAILPGKTDALENNVGLAVGFSFELERCRFFFLPGVPHEMRAMFQNGCLPAIETRIEGGGELRHHQWRCLNVPESELQRAMDPIEKVLPSNAWLGYRTRFPENHLTLYWRMKSPADERLFLAQQERIRSIVGKWTYTESNHELETLVMQGLAKRAWRLATAESCTGGLVGQRLTRLAGSSQHFWGSYTVYQIGAKAKMLGVDLENPDQAVSKECTRRLAEETLRHSGVEIAAAITGYMGPGGGTEEDPLGTIYICVAGKKGVQEMRIANLVRDREQMQWGSATHVLNAVRVYLESFESNP